MTANKPRKKPSRKRQNNDDDDEDTNDEDAGMSEGGRRWRRGRGSKDVEE